MRFYRNLILLLPVLFILTIQCWNPGDFDKSNSSYAGAIDGRFSVSSSGGAVYNIPITAIPGRANMTPNLALIYNSKGGNGIAGMGVRLNGLSIIEREAPTPAQDGFRASVNYISTDRFSLDGQRLMAIKGEYGSDSTVYHTETESWSKVISYGDCGDGPCWFKVFTKQGNILEYGNSTDSRIEATGSQSVRVWCLNSITDLNGNYALFHYLKDSLNGAWYPLGIYYAGNTNTGYKPARSLKFYYKSRPDSTVSYLGGKIIRTTKRLSRITTFLDEDSVLSYSLSYQNGKTTGRSLLRTVTECDVSGKCLPSTTLNWQESDTALLAPSVAISPKVPESDLYPMDVDGNGLIDMVSITNSPQDLFVIRPYLSTGINLSESEDTLILEDVIRGGNVLSADVNGDGLVDLIYNIDNGSDPWSAMIMLSHGSGFDKAISYNPPVGDPSTAGKLYTLDINGDSRSDLVYGKLKDNVLTLASYLSDGVSFTPDTTQQLSIDPHQTDGNLSSTDVNGDGLFDLALTTTSGNATDSIQITVLLSNGSSFSIQTLQSFSFYGGSDGVLMPADFNGDRLTDFLYAGKGVAADTLKLSLFLSNGRSYEPAYHLNSGLTTSIDEGTFIPAELNGDQMSDLIFLTGDNSPSYLLTAFLSTGEGFNGPLPLSQTTGPASGIPIPLDLNGDARTDLLYGATTTLLSGDHYDFSAYISSGDYPGLADTIDNGIGGKISIQYKPLTDTAVYSKDGPNSNLGLPANNFMSSITGATYPYSGTASATPAVSGASFPVTVVQLPLYAVAAYSKSNSRQQAWSYSFHYSGAKVNTDGRGWLGFASKTITDSSLDVINTSFYQQAFPLTGSTDSSFSRRLSDNALMIRRKSLYQTYFPLANDTGVVQVLLSASYTDQFDYGTYIYTTGSEYTYDPYGNTVLLANLNDTAGNNLVYTLNTYDNDTGNWQLGYLLQQQISSSSSGEDTLQLNKNEYQAGTRNIIRASAWDDQHKQWLSTIYNYDGYGNSVYTVNPANDTTQYTFDPEYYSFSILQRRPPVNGLSLVDSFAYNYGFGVQTSHTDPNGNTIVQLLDGLGRVSATLGPDPSGEMDTLTAVSYTLSGDSGYYSETRTLVDWDGSTHWVRSYLDGQLRNYRIISQGVRDKLKVTERVYDSKNRVIRETLPFYKGDSLIRWSSTTFDPLGRVIRFVHPKDDIDSSVSVMYYQGKTVVTTKAWGTSDSTRLTTHYDYYNGSEVHTQQVAEDGGETTFYYDLLGRPDYSTDPSGTKISSRYNSLGRQVSGENVSRGSYVKLYYDSLRFTLQVTNSTDTVISRFDPLGRLINYKYSPSDSILFEYDLSSQENSIGRLSRITSAAGNYTSYNYDVYGNITNSVFHIDGTDYTSSWAYSPVQKIISQTYPDGSVLNNEYTVEGYLDNISLEDVSDGINGAINYADFEDYTALGKVTGINYGNGAINEYQYFSTGQLRGVKVFNSSDSLILDRDFNRNYLSRITELTDNQNASYSQNFQYDAVGRLQQAKGIYGQKGYSYDPSGNLIQKDSIQRSYSNYQLYTGVSDGDTAFSLKYDARGNMLQKMEGSGLTEFTYDLLDRLVKVTRNDTLLLEFVYDHSNDRVKKIDHRNQTTTLYISRDYEVVTFADNTAQYTKYIPGPSGSLASVTHNSDTSQIIKEGIPSRGTLYFHQDHLNSTSISTDAEGSISSKTHYLPYGEVYSLSGSDNFRYKFGGKELDETSGLLYFSARYYDPELAVFITADSRLGGPRSHSDVFNNYVYALNNPVNYTDPSGHNVFSWVSKNILHNGSAVASLMIGGLEIATGVALDILSAGSLSLVGGSLIDAGLAGVTYSSTHFNNFSWKTWGIQEGTQAAVGLATAGMGGFLDEGGVAAADMADEEGIEMTRMGSNVGDETGATPTEDMTAQSEKNGCFVAGTLISTPAGLVPIEDINVGQVVWAFDEKTGKREARKVLQLFRPIVHKLVIITLTNGEEITTTEEHPFYVNRKWVPAGQLSNKDILTGPNGHKLAIHQIEYRKVSDKQVYNFEVDEAHTYFVSTHEVLVHNQCVTRSQSKKSQDAKWNRSSFRQGTENNAWADAADDPTSPGHKLCPTCGGRITGDKFPVGTKRVRMVRDYDLDHVGATWHDRIVEMQGREANGNGTYTRDEVLDEYNRNIRLQCPACNRSHQHEPTQAETNAYNKTIPQPKRRRR